MSRAEQQREDCDEEKRKSLSRCSYLLSWWLSSLDQQETSSFTAMCPTMCSVSLRNEWRVSRLLVCYDWIEMIKLRARKLESREIRMAAISVRLEKKFVIWKSSRLGGCRCQCRARELIFTLNFPCDLLLLPLLARLLSLSLLSSALHVL